MDLKNKIVRINAVVFDKEVLKQVIFTFCFDKTPTQASLSS